MGIVFNNFLHFSGLMGIVCCQNSFIVELFWHSRIYGHDFQKFSRCMGILLRNFSGLMGILLRVVLLQFEWQNSVSWKLMLTPPPGSWDCQN